MLVELKNGETLNGHLVQCDTYMNLTLKEVVQTSPDGDKFFRLPECYVRGNNVSLLAIRPIETSSSPCTTACTQVARSPTDIHSHRSNTSASPTRLST
jgi:small nuclear ribonucleoprotein (snRNP)-like protein